MIVVVSVGSGEAAVYFFVRGMIPDSRRGRGPGIRLSQDEEDRVIKIERCKFLLTKELVSFFSFRAYLELVPESLSGYEVNDVGAYLGDTAIFKGRICW